MDQPPDLPRVGHRLSIILEQNIPVPSSIPRVRQLPPIRHLAHKRVHLWDQCQHIHGPGQEYLGNWAETGCGRGVWEPVGVQSRGAILAQEAQWKGQLIFGP